MTAAQHPAQLSTKVMVRTNYLIFAFIPILSWGDVLAAPPPLIREPSINSLPFTTRRFYNDTVKNIVAADRARIAQIKQDCAQRLAAGEPVSPFKRASYSFTVTNAAVSYSFPFLP
jgi:hypothetical protein